MTSIALDVDSVRADFPILKQQIHGRPLVYLDSGASAQKPEVVTQAVSDYYRRDHSNVRCYHGRVTVLVWLDACTPLATCIRCARIMHTTTTGYPPVFVCQHVWCGDFMCQATTVFLCNK
jgi:hypothetical protein